MKKGAVFTEKHRQRLSEVRRQRIAAGLIVSPKGMLGKKHTLKTRLNISLNHKSKNPENNLRHSLAMKKAYAEGRIVISPEKRKWSPEHRVLFKASMIKSFDLKGRKTKRERTVLSGRQEYKIWRISVFQRDNWTCQSCHARGVYLEAHHIKAWSKFPESRYSVTNGVTLCKPCHKLTDNYGGKSK